MIKRRISASLAASILQGALALVVIPIATSVLSARDYGEYALVVGIAGLFVALCENGSSSILYVNYKDLQEEKQDSLVLTLFTYSLLWGIAVATMAVLAIQIGSAKMGFDFDDSVTSTIALWFFIISSVLLNIVGPILIIRKEAERLAVCTAAQAVTGFAVLLLCLLVLGMGARSLLVGASTGQVMSVCVGLAFLYRCKKARIDFSWIKRGKKIGLTNWISIVIESLKLTVEKAALGGATGLESVGLLSHATTYMQLLKKFGNSISEAVWPNALDGAGGDKDAREKVQQAWNLFYLLCGLAGICSIVFGEEVIRLVSNNRFQGAAEILAALIAILLVQNSGKMDTAAVYRGAKVVEYNKIRVAAVVSSCIVGLILIRYIGIYAVLISALIDAFLTRSMVHMLAKGKIALQLKPSLPFVLSGVLVLSIVIKRIV